MSLSAWPICSSIPRWDGIADPELSLHATRPRRPSPPPWRPRMLAPPPWRLAPTARRLAPPPWRLVSLSAWPICSSIPRWDGIADPALPLQATRPRRPSPPPWRPRMLATPPWRLAPTARRPTHPWRPRRLVSFSACPMCSSILWWDGIADHVLFLQGTRSRRAPPPPRRPWRLATPPWRLAPPPWRLAPPPRRLAPPPWRLASPWRPRRLVSFSACAICSSIPWWDWHF